MIQTIKAMQSFGCSLTQVLAINDTPSRLCYCILCESHFYAKVGGEPHRCLPPVPEEKVARLARGVAYGPNPPRPHFSTAEENQRWVERLRKRVGNG